jgi:uncharacterized protein YxeA
LGESILKKILIIIGVVIGLVIGFGYGTYKILDNVENYQEKNTDNEARSVAAPEENDDSPYASKQEEYQEQTKNIGGQIFELKLTDATTEREIIDIMHKMTHQKVKAEDKWGAIPMSEHTVSQVLEFLEKSKFATKEDLMDIAKKWKSGDFQTVDYDHNFFWQWQGGTVGRAYGIMSSAEEEEFIKNNF